LIKADFVGEVSCPILNEKCTVKPEGLTNSLTKTEINSFVIFKAYKNYSILKIGRVYGKI
jgi:hypothetical protein